MVTSVEGINSRSITAVEEMEPKSVAGQIGGAGEPPLAETQPASSAEAIVETVLEVPPRTPLQDKSTVGSPPGSDSREGLRRTTPKIASLKATFERSHSEGSLKGARKLEKSKSPSRNGDHDAEALRSKDGEIAKLKDLLEKETELKQALEDKCNALEEDVERLESELEQHDGDWRAEMDQQNKKLALERDRAQDAFVEIKRQLLGLKRSISTSTRVDSQYPDLSFTAEMQNLYHEMQNWVVNTFRRMKMERPAEEMLASLESVVESKHLHYLRPLFRDWDPANKLAALQAVVACYLMEVWSDPLLFGLPVWRKGVKKATETMSAILPNSSYEKWRSGTLDTIKQNADIKDAVDSAAKALSEMICITLTSLTGAEESAAMSSSLHAIVKRVVSLSHVFRVQHAQYQFVLPEPGSPFDQARMDDTSLEATSSFNTITCAAFPLVLKLGSGSGEDVEPTRVVVKAKVICRP
ncbi:hypothetical protein CKM354_000431500 [Cercospora kikuchii]|uniref:Uncharacterized protein n=1 Tax=Cercospora kikuchii TaxID=84275 RepID=A0A9P3FEI0_9PEZI|nr:uncharacterized protein CKM354_000431500 [Cercospora kikuchii]GIZ40997.1 hypothetical protein CKM354_000431500 [Cercospora kikuchii]